MGLCSDACKPDAFGFLYELDRCVCERCFSWTSKGGSGKASFANAAVLFFRIALLPRKALIIRARLFSVSRAPLNPSGLIEFYFAFFLFVLGGFLLSILPLRV